MPSGQVFPNSSCADRALPVSYCLLAPNKWSLWHAWDVSGIRVVFMTVTIVYCVVYQLLPKRIRQRRQIARNLQFMCNLHSRPPAISRQELFILILIGIFIQHCMSVLQMYRVSLHTAPARPRHHATRLRTFGEVQDANLQIKVHRSLALGEGYELFDELDIKATDSAYLVRCEDARRLVRSTANYDDKADKLRWTVVWQPMFTGIRGICDKERRLFEAGLLKETTVSSSVPVKSGPDETNLCSYRAGLVNYFKLLISWLTHLSIALVVFILECRLGRKRRVTPLRLIRSKSEPCLGGGRCRWLENSIRRFSSA